MEEATKSQKLSQDHVRQAGRICIVRNAYYDFLVPNRRNAQTLVAAGYEVDIICQGRKDEKKQETIDGATVYRLPIGHRRGGLRRYFFEYIVFFWLAFWKLSVLSPRRKYHIVEVSGIPDFLVFCAAVPRLFGAKVIWHLLDHTPEVFMEHFKLGRGNAFIRLLRLVEKASAHWVDYVIGTQIINKQILESRGVRSSKISVVLNVPIEAIFNGRPSPPPKNGTFRVMTHGSFLERYGVQTLIQAVPLLLADIPNLKVKLVGEGQYRPQLQQLVKSLGVEKYVEFTGLVPQAEVPRYISDAHIGVVTILTKTNPMLPNKLFEYLAMGKPTISTSIPAITAYFDDKAVMFYEPGDAQSLARCILELYHHPRQREELAEAGSASYQKYRWVAMKHEYLRVYNQMTAADPKE